MKTKLSVALMTLALIGLTATMFAADFTVDVKIDSADAGTSLTFGSGTAQEQPFPPISLMFGVKDVFLANPANVGVATAGEMGDLSRLSVDVRPGAVQWVIVSNSDTKLFFAKSSGTPTLYWATKDNEAGESDGGMLKDSLSVSAGLVYTILTTPVTKETASAAAATVAEDPQNATAYAYEGEGDDKGVFSATQPDAVDATGTNMIYIAATEENLYFVEKNGSTFRKIDGTTTTTRPENATIITVDGATLGALANYMLPIVPNGSPTLSFEGTSSSKEITTTFAGDGGKLAAITWIIKTFGTLDFDGNGEVDYNDAIFFFNYATGAVTAEELMAYALPSNSLAEDAQAALEFFDVKADSLVFDGDAESGSALYDNAIYFFNYMTGAVSAEELVSYSIANDLEKAQNALDKIESLIGE